MLYIKWTLIYLAIPVWYLLLIGFFVWIIPDYKPIMISIPILMIFGLIVALIINTVKQEKQNIK